MTEQRALSRTADNWEQTLIDDCKAIATEALTLSRWELIAGYHALGRRIVDETNLDRKATYGKKILKRISESIKTSERNIYYAIQFYEKYPKLDKLPGGKNVSWSKIVKSLPEPKQGTKSTHWRWHWTRIDSQLDALVSFDGELPERVKSWVLEGIEIRKELSE